MSRLSLRVAHVWGGTLLEERRFAGSVFVSSDGRSDFTVGDTRTELFARGGPTWQLTPAPGTRGDVWLAGHRRSIEELEGVALQLAPGDWGVLRFAGEHQLGFEVTTRDAKLPAPPLGDTGLSWPAALLAFTLHALLVGASFGIASWPTAGEGALGGYVVQIGRPRPRPPEPPKPVEKKKEEAAAATVAKPAPTVEKAGKAGGEGQHERARSPVVNPNAQDKMRTRVESAGILKQRDTLAAIAKPGAADARLANAVAQAGDNGNGNGHGGGVGPENGEGATRGGNGPGGGGTNPADALSHSPVDTGNGHGGRKGPGGPKLTEAKVTMTAENPDGDFGGLTQEQVRAVVEKHRAALQYCFEKELQKDPKLSGRVVVNWRIDASGLVTTAKIKSSTVANPDVDDCLVRQVRKWQFPVAANGQVTDVRYPFVFSGH